MGQRLLLRGRSDTAIIMAEPVKLEKYQILVAPDSKKTQGLRTGDIVRRQYFDGTNIVYSLMCVLSYGTTKKDFIEAKYDDDGLPLLDTNGNIITESIERDVPYFIGALLEGDAPKTKELLDFARITSLFDTNRSGALYLTASDDEAPFMDVIDGIGRNKSLCWPENIASEAFQDPHSQYITKGDGLLSLFKGYQQSSNSANPWECNRVIRLTRNAATTSFSGLSQEFYELIPVQKRILISYKARASKSATVKAEIAYANEAMKDAEWTEELTEDWHYYLQAVTVINSGRHLRTFNLDFQSLGIGDWVEIADFNIILLDSISNFGETTSMRIGKLDGIADPVFGHLTGYGAYVQKLYASQTAHISGTLTAGDENGFASTFYAGKIHRNCFINSCDINFTSAVTIDDTSLLNPTGMGHVYKITTASELSMKAQTRDWLNKHLDKRFCFSLWSYAKKPCLIGIRQNGRDIGTIQIASDQCYEWRRIHIFFDLLKPLSADEQLLISLSPSFSNSFFQSVSEISSSDIQELFITAPQLEAGEICTQYQPTDDILDETNDYGAWFARGGIGGTIQNPLLRLNYDGTGAIDTRQKSFRLNQDGSGYLANENIKWDKNGKVTFGKDVTLNWDNLGKDVQDEMANRYMRIVGHDTFTIIGEDDPITGRACTPSYIKLTLEEVGFTSASSQRQWFLLIGDNWVEIPNANGSNLEVLPDSCYWLGYVTPPPTHDANGDEITYTGEDCITFKCSIVLNNERTYTDIFSVKKQYVQGYTVQITSSKGEVFQNGVCSTVLTATVYYQGQPINAEYALENFTFNWHRYKINDLNTDVGFTDLDVNDGANVITLNYDMDGTDVFVCELGVPNYFDYTFPIIF